MKRVICILLFFGAVSAVQLTLPFPSGTGVFSVSAADEHDDVLQAIKRGELMTYAKIKRIAEAKLQGVVVGQKLRRTNRGWQYDLRIRRKDGKVMVAIVDARTGEIVATR
ncbi:MULTISPECIES: PepSY domain-containing protein [Kordiimonas]|jgi:uncharacterized membrane protein YkoI|uniref:PepSY domain-containing protein n=1 Tax=Kordiimonas lacus TaxID=637679 RepID=A0A1G7DNW8_9PROT|nr:MULTISPECIES: hypothetical protein [Kordiimonas]SDE53149.1 hypothetical protein SAMN04488071_3191 [Kordiimonas lacus]